MSLPYFPMFPADFEADTSHLTLEEDGAYNRLLRLCWMTPGCSVPDEAAWIARRMRVDAATYERVIAPLIGEFFKRKDGRVYSPRLMSIWLETDEKHKRRVEAGKKGGRPPKALESNGSGQSNAKAMPKQPEPEPEPEVREGANAPSEGARKRASMPAKSRMTDDWPLSEAGREFARSHGFSDVETDEMLAEFRIYWMDRRDRDASKSQQGWDVTWKNRVKAVAARFPRRAPNVIPLQPKGRANALTEGFLAAINDARMAAGPGDDASVPLLPARH